MRRMRASLGLILLLALLALSASCSGKDEGANGSDDNGGASTSGVVSNDADNRMPVDLLRGAPAAAAEAKTVYIDGSITMEGVPGFKADGLTMTMQGGVDIENSRADLTMTGAGVRIQMVQDATALYMKLAGFSQRWIKMDYSTLFSDEGAQQLFGGGQSNPVATLEYLRGVSESIEEVGKEDIRGVETTHYRATVDIAKSLEEARKYLDEDVLEMLDANASAFAGEYPVDVWVDGDSLVRRIAMTITYDGAEMPAELNGVTMTVTTDYYDYGKPVDVEIPDESEVDDWSEVFGGLTG